MSSGGVTFAPGLLEAPSRQFHAGDYVVFALTLLVSAIIGLYIGIRYRHKMTVRDMLLGGRNLGTIPVSLSLVATVTSTIFVLGVPSETYYGGDWPLYIAFAFIPATIITVHVFIPIFHKLEVTSAYEYLGVRFNSVIRFAAALVYIVLANFTQALSLYTPAVGFSLVAGVSLDVSILTAGCICTFYTALGGLRAVVITDIFQIGTILIGILALLIKGSIDAGGIEKIFQTGPAGKRIQLWAQDWTENTTYGFWAQFFGGTVIFLSLCASNQQTVQRYCAVKTCRDAQKAAYIAMVFYVITWVMVLLIGLVIYTFYYTCDPLVLQVIYNPDQVLPLFIMDMLGHLHGVPGLFSAAVFGAVLSSVSSGINSLAAVTLEDLIRPVHRRLKKKPIEEEVGRALTRSLALFYGIMTVAFSYIPVKYGTYFSNLEVTFSAFGVLGGPIIGLFLLGTLVPLANSKGAGVGLLVSLGFGIWLWIGHSLCRNSGEVRRIFIDPTDCGSYYNLTGFDPNARQQRDEWPGQRIFTDCPMQQFYDIPFLWWGLICMTITVIVGVIVSALSGGHNGKVLNPDLLCWERLKRKRREGRGLWGRAWDPRPKKAKRAKWLNVDSNVPRGPNPLIMKTSDKYLNTNTLGVGPQPVIDHSGMLHGPYHLVGPNVVAQSSPLADPDGVLYQGDIIGIQPIPGPSVVLSPGDELGMSAMTGPSGVLSQPDATNMRQRQFSPVTDPDNVLHQPMVLDPSLLRAPVADPGGVLYTGDPGPTFNSSPQTTVMDPDGVLHQPGQPIANIEQYNTTPIPLSGTDTNMLFHGEYNHGYMPDHVGNLGNPGLFHRDPISPDNTFYQPGNTHAHS